MFYYIGTFLLLVVAFLYTVAPGNSSDKARLPFFGRSYAFRGLFNKAQTVPENSLAAFAAAVRAGYGITADLQLTQDRRLVVFADGKLTRLCKTDMRVCDLTYAELQEYPLGESDERIPLFSDLLALVDGQVPIIAYLRSGKDNETLCKISSELMLAYEGPIAMASYSPAIVGWFRDRKATKRIMRAGLAAPRSTFPAGNNWHYTMVSLGMLNSVGRPQLIIWPDMPKNFTIKIAISLGAVKCTGPLGEGCDLEKALTENDIIIFQHITPPVQFKNMQDYAQMAAEYERRRKAKRSQLAEDTLIETYLAAEEDIADDTDADANNDGTEIIEAAAGAAVLRTLAANNNAENSEENPEDTTGEADTDDSAE